MKLNIDSNSLTANGRFRDSCTIAHHAVLLPSVFTNFFSFVQNVDRYDLFSDIILFYL